MLHQKEIVHQMKTKNITPKLHVNTVKKILDSNEVLLPIFWEFWIFFQYNIEKKENSDDEEEDEDEDDDDFGGGGKKAESDDPAERKIPISAGNSTAALRNFLISSVEGTNLKRNLLFLENPITR